jgi:predicted transposase/invertase (TIGR01784 family)
LAVPEILSSKKDEFDMLRERYEELDHHVAKLIHLSADEEARREYERREKIIRDYESGLYLAKTKGIEEGKTEVAQAMLQYGMQVSLVARLTGLAQEEIELLKTH